MRTPLDTLTDERREVILNAETELKLRVISFSNYRPTFLGDSATGHAIKNTELRKIDDDRFYVTRDWFERNGWLLTRQVLRSPPFTGTELHYLAPLEYLQVTTVYHATRPHIDSCYQ